MNIQRMKDVPRTLLLPIAMLVSGAANALTITLDDLSTGGIDQVVVDNGAGDISGTSGLINFSGSVGTWSIVINIASNQLVTPELQPFGIEVQNFSASAPAAGAQLQVTVWDFFDTTSNPVVLATDWAAGLSSTLGLGANPSVVGNFYQYDGTTTNIISTETLSIGGLASADTGLLVNQPLVSSTNMGLGIDLLITASSAGQSAGVSATLQPVPLPAAAWLFGSALLGTAMLGRRRLKKT